MAETGPGALVAPTKINSTTGTDGPTPITQIQNSTTNETPSQRTTPAPPTTSPSQTSDTSKHPSAAYPVFAFPSRLPCPPFINVSGVPNFRSLGGYLSANGTTIVRPNLFYRCAHLTQITPEGLEHLASTLGIKAIYDLRSGPEVARITAGAVAAAAAAHHHITGTSASTSIPPIIPSCSPLYESLRHFTPVYATEESGPDALARKLKWYSSPSTPLTLPYPYSEGFVNAYRDIATHGAPAYTAIFRHVLTRSNDPFIFHCTAGKDRTGVFAALVLRLAGVDDETICWEYAVTEPGLGDWRTLFIDRMSGGATLHNVSEPPKQNHTNGVGAEGAVSSQRKENMTREEAARVCGSRAGNMRAWLTLVLDGEFGGAEKYLTRLCGFDEEQVRVIKEHLVVGLAVVGEEAVVRPCGIQGWTADGGCEV